MTMYRPGADRSGFMKPSAVGPYADHEARVSSETEFVAPGVQRADRDHERIVGREPRS